MCDDESREASTSRGGWGADLVRLYRTTAVGARSGVQRSRAASYQLTSDSLTGFPSPQSEAL